MWTFKLTDLRLSLLESICSIFQPLLCRLVTHGSHFRITLAIFSHSRPKGRCCKDLEPSVWRYGMVSSVWSIPSIARPIRRFNGVCLRMGDTFAILMGGNDGVARETLAPPDAGNLAKLGNNLPGANMMNAGRVRLDHTSVRLCMLCFPSTTETGKGIYRRWTNYSNPCNPITPRAPNYVVFWFGSLLRTK